MERIHAAGAELYFIGNGNAFFARGFRDEFSVPVPIYVDEERVSYKALGLKRNLGSTLNLQILRNARRARAAGFSQKAVEGDAWQQGGVMIVRPDGEVAYSYVSGAAGDHPPVDEVVAALEG